MALAGWGTDGAAAALISAAGNQRTGRRNVLPCSPAWGMLAVRWSLTTSRKQLSVTLLEEQLALVKSLSMIPTSGRSRRLPERRFAPKRRSFAPPLLERW